MGGTLDLVTNDTQLSIYRVWFEGSNQSWAVLLGHLTRHSVWEVNEKSAGGGGGVVERAKRHRNKG